MYSINRKPFKFLKFFSILSSLWPHMQLVTSSAAFSEECLQAHNELRARHDAPPLVLDGELNAYAKEWADHLLNVDRLLHRSAYRYGENVAQIFHKRNITAWDPVNAWYAEINNYDYNNPVFSISSGHFTQVIWKNSKRLGCAAANKDTTTYIVANYDPPGNYRGRFAANVLPLK